MRGIEPEWLIEYRQTADERYESSMNDLAEEQVRRFALRVVGTAGGSSFDAGGMVAENCFYVTGDALEVEKAARSLAVYLDRRVTFSLREAEV